MIYKITVAEIIEIDGEKYPSTNTVYEQSVEASSPILFITDVIKAVNGL